MTRAFVLAGGASLGSIQAGMLRALYEAEIAPDLIVATSAGAVNGAYIASRPPTPQTAAGLADIWRGLTRGAVFPLNPIASVLGIVGRSDHLVSDRGLRRLVERYIEFDTLEAARTPLHVITTDLLSGEERRLSRGDAVDAVLASASIPGVFPPVEWGGRMLVDGGVIDNTPVSDAIELGAEEVYVLPTGSACALERPPGSSLSIALHALSLLIQQRLVDDIEKARAGARVIVLPPPCPLTVTPIDFSHASMLIDEGYANAVEALADPRPGVIPGALRSHPHHGAALHA